MTRFGPKHTTEAPSPLDLTDAERERMHREMARARLARETYERNQRRYSVGPNLRATPIVPLACTSCGESTCAGCLAVTR